MWKLYFSTRFPKIDMEHKQGLTRNLIMGFFIVFTCIGPKFGPQTLNFTCLKILNNYLAKDYFQNESCTEY
jgi:hypothetical protein